MKEYSFRNGSIVIRFEPVAADDPLAGWMVREGMPAFAMYINNECNAYCFSDSEDMASSYLSALDSFAEADAKEL